METAKVSAKGQIDVPAAVRWLLHLNAGDKALFIVDGEGVRMRNASSLNLEKKEGSAHAEEA